MTRSRDEHVARWLARARRQVRGTAHHEGGHVAAAAVLGLGVSHGSGASIEPDASSWGRAHIGRWLSDDELAELRAASAAGVPGPARRRRRLEALVVAVMAGPLAEERAYFDGLAEPEPEPTYELGVRLLERERRVEELVVHGAALAAGEPPSHSDAELVDELLFAACATENEAHALRFWLRERAEALVASEPFWRATCAVAGALLEHGTLSGRGCSRIARAELDGPRP